MNLDEQVDIWENQIRQRQSELKIEPFELISQMDSESLRDLMQSEPGVVQSFLLLHLEPMKSAQVLLHIDEIVRTLLLSRINQAQTIPDDLSHQFEAALERKINTFLKGNPSNNPSILEWVEGIDRCFCIS